jgi:hypothetical protein
VAEKAFFQDFCVAGCAVPSAYTLAAMGTFHVSRLLCCAKKWGFKKLLPYPGGFFNPEEKPTTGPLQEAGEISTGARQAHCHP